MVVVAGGWVAPLMHEMAIEEFHKVMKTNFESNWCKSTQQLNRSLLMDLWIAELVVADAYRATIPYLLEQKAADSSFTQCTGGAPDYGLGGVTGKQPMHLPNFLIRPMANLIRKA